MVGWLVGFGMADAPPRHCERSEATQNRIKRYQELGWFTSAGEPSNVFGGLRAVLGCFDSRECAHSRDARNNEVWTDIDKGLVNHLTNLKIGECHA